MAVEKLVIQGATIVFEPGSGWQWHGWNGKVKLNVQDRGSTSEGGSLAVEPDLVALAKELCGKSYTAEGFADIPGIAAAASVTVDAATLSTVTTVANLKAARANTTGKFQISTVPSFKAAAPPVPDPVPIHDSHPLRIMRTRREAL